MKPHVRAAMAASAIAVSSNSRVSSVYSFQETRHRSISVKFDGRKVDGFDHVNSCHFGGNIPSLFHYGEGSHVNLKDKGGGKFDGFDYGSSCHFQITVKNKNADVYDYGAGGYFSYSA